MTVYVVDCYWTMYAQVRIEANSAEEAENKVHEADLPPGDYVEDSLETYVKNEGKARDGEPTG